MNFEQMKALMGEGADKELIQSALSAVNEDTKTQIESETNGLLENKTKLLNQMDKLKKNQIPEGFDSGAYEKYNEEKEEFDKKKKELADAELEGKGQWEALKIQLSESHKNALEKLTSETGSRITSLQTALDKELIENNAIKAIEAEKGSSLFLLPHMSGQMKTVLGEDGNYSVQVLDKDGKQRFADDATTPFTVKDLVAEFKANNIYSAAFPELNNGSGNEPGPGGKGGNGANPWKLDTKNVTEQARLTKENPTLAAQFKKAANVK